MVYEKELYPPPNPERYTTHVIHAGMCFMASKERRQIWVITDIGSDDYNDFYAGAAEFNHGVLTEVARGSTVKPHTGKITIIPNLELGVEDVIYGFENWFRRVEGDHEEGLKLYRRDFRRTFQKGSKTIYILK